MANKNVTVLIKDMIVYYHIFKSEQTADFRKLLHIRVEFSKCLRPQ